MNCGDFSEAGQGGMSPFSTKRPIAKAYAVASEATSSFIWNAPAVPSA